MPHSPGRQAKLAPPPRAFDLLHPPQKVAVRTVIEGVTDRTGAPFLDPLGALTYALMLAAAVVRAGRHSEFTPRPLSLAEMIPTDAELARAIVRGTRRRAAVPAPAQPGAST